MQRSDVLGRLGLRPLPRKIRGCLLNGRRPFGVLTTTQSSTSVAAVSEEEKRPSEIKISNHDSPEILKVTDSEANNAQDATDGNGLGATAFRFQAAIAWVASAVAFGFGVDYFLGAEKAEEYFAGYILEQSLSVDNLFVFILIFKYFQTPLSYQPKVLNFGIVTAGVLRLIMVLLGAEIVDLFHPVLLLFAGLLIYSSYQLLVVEDRHEDDLEDNFIVRSCNRIFSVSDRYDGDRFFTFKDGIRTATPLLLTLAVIEFSDVVFAVDSVPAVFGITLDPFIVYSSNLFAILSLRSFYGFVSTVLDRLRFLDKSVAIVLGLIGFKMVGEVTGYEVSTEVSLTVVAAVLGGGVLLSLVFPND